ncbi:hypothetical protein GKO32_25510 [Amycolatopsis sp. RM579]|uniref:Resolvase/invertase-type recombinase catalytic domain-containing protein n=1 Tax=Amycolatopsis pithecellobii TaxID=664692 RepID=A0A6N7Z8X4_9PSEU|nr:hypothetical protein [Amycolatopsis pithecellobii]
MPRPRSAKATSCRPTSPPNLSGASLFAAATTAARSGDIDVLVVKHMYSLSRTTRQLADLLDELTSLGVRLVSAADPGLDTGSPFGLFLVRVVSAVAEIEYTGALADRRDRLRHKTARCHEQRLCPTGKRTTAGQPCPRQAAVGSS